MKKQLVAREQEITAVQARMQASYREHVKEVQQLQGKVGGAAGPGQWAGVGGPRWVLEDTWSSASGLVLGGGAVSSGQLWSACCACVSCQQSGR